MAVRVWDIECEVWNFPTNTFVELLINMEAFSDLIVVNVEMRQLGIYRGGAYSP